MNLTRFLYCAMLGNAILFFVFFFLLQNQNYFERMKKTPSVTTEIIITFFSILQAHQCYIMKGKMISPRLSLTVPNKYANFIGSIRKP